MDTSQKNILLYNCNSIPVEDIFNIIQSGDITLEEFRTAGLAQDKINELEILGKKIAENNKKQEDSEELKKLKTISLNRVIKGNILADDIKGLINKKLITYDELLDAGLPIKTVNALKRYCSTERINRSYTIDELPVMEEGRTDVYFVGLPGSGKSTMIAGILYIANQKGLLLPDPYHPAGVNFQTDLIQDLRKGVLPNRTAVGSYNYIAASFKDSNENRHPLNIVDVPGELYEKIQDNAEVDKFLKYINNKNKKVIIFVIDSLEHDNMDSVSKFDQSVVFPNILQIFNKNGVLEQTDAIYLVVNKFDAIKESNYAFDNRPCGDIALEFLNIDFLGLKNNCIAAREDTRNTFKIKVMPFSIGSLSFGSILNKFDSDFAQSILNQITKDSFVIRGGAHKIFNK